MDPLLIIVGALYLTWPLVYRNRMGRIRVRLSERGGDLERFEHRTNRRWILAMLWLSPVLGLVCVIAGLLGW
jgi:membrane protein YqaA with SNARE-associated domain